MDAPTFRAMCVKHDVTYQYAEGPDYAKGKAQLDAIRVAAKMLPPDVARQIWNDVIDSKMLPRARAQWYWRLN